MPIENQVYANTYYTGNHHLKTIYGSKLLMKHNCEKKICMKNERFKGKMIARDKLLWNKNIQTYTHNKSRISNKNARPPKCGRIWLERHS